MTDIRPLMGAILTLVMLFSTLGIASTGDVENLPVSSKPSLGGGSGCSDQNPLQRINLQFGWPRQMEGNARLWGKPVTVLDFDNNRDWEFSIITTEARLYTFQHDGAFYPGFPLDPYHPDRPEPWENPNHRVVSAVGDVDGDGYKDLVYITDIGFLHVVGETGAEPEPFPIDLGRHKYAGIPAVVNLRGNRNSEIVFNTINVHPDSLDLPATMHVIEDVGQQMDDWPVEYPHGSTSSPSVGDIDGDGQFEIVVGNARHLDQPAQIYAWNLDGSSVEGFPFGEFETIHAAPALADLDGDGALEILIWGSEYNSHFNGIYAVKGSAELMDGFPVECESGHPQNSPVCADITGDNSPEIVFGSFGIDGGGMVYAWSSNGEILDGYPLRLDRPVIGSVILGDVSGDRICDIVVALSPLGESPGAIAAWDFESEMIEGFPLSMSRWNGGALAGTPTLWDLDRDGDLDLIAATTDLRLMVWDTHGYPTRDAWLSEKGGMSRTGMRQADDPEGITIPDKPPVPVKWIASAYPNPFNRSTFITVPTFAGTGLHVDLFDLTGRRIGRLISEDNLDTSGDTRFHFDASEYCLPAGIYLCSWSNGYASGMIKLLYCP